MEKCGPCPVFASFTLAFALQLWKKHGKTSVRVRKTSIRLRKTSVTVQYTYYQKHPHFTKPSQTHTLQSPLIHTHTHTHTTKQYKTTTVQIKMKCKQIINNITVIFFQQRFRSEFHSYYRFCERSCSMLGTSVNYNIRHLFLQNLL